MPRLKHDEPSQSENVSYMPDNLLSNIVPLYHCAQSKNRVLIIPSKNSKSSIMGWSFLISGGWKNEKTNLMICKMKRRYFENLQTPNDVSMILTGIFHGLQQHWAKVF